SGALDRVRSLLARRGGARPRGRRGGGERLEPDPRLGEPRRPDPLRPPGSGRSGGRDLESAGDVAPDDPERPGLEPAAPSRTGPRAAGTARRATVSGDRLQ